MRRQRRRLPPPKRDEAVDEVEDSLPLRDRRYDGEGSSETRETSVVATLCTNAVNTSEEEMMPIRSTILARELGLGVDVDRGRCRALHSALATDPGEASDGSDGCTVSSTPANAWTAEAGREVAVRSTMWRW